MVRATSNSVLPGAFAVDSNSAFEAVLTDIPLFCAGLTGLASVTFVFFIKRVDSSTLYLGIGTLLLFIAAILDLGQLLQSQTSPADKDSVDVSGFIVAREVGLGLAYGFVFLFAWNAVVQLRELKRPLSASAQQQLLHDAGWTRWLKLVRKAVKWFSLVLVILIGLFQVSWRIIPSQRQYGGLYIVESTLEIVTSTILIFAAILDILMPLPASWWPPFQSYLGLILGLLITAAIGIGNLVMFAFSEMVLGRFLRAISIYTFLLFHLVTIFSAITRDHRRHHYDEEVQSRLEKATEQNIDDALEPAAPAPPNGKPSPLSITASSRLSMLVSRVEPVETLAGVTRTLSNRKSSSTPITPKRQRRPDLRFDIMTPVLSSMLEDPEPVRERPTTDISLTYYTMGLRVSAAASTPNRERSGNFGPDGQSGREADSQQTNASGFQPPDHRGFSITSSEEIMREHEELEKSIARLGIPPIVTQNELSQETGFMHDSSMSPTRDPTPSTRSRRQSTLKTDSLSLSLHSDFSLSIFPIPPPLPESMPGERRLSRTTFRRRKLPPLPTDDTTQKANPVQESPVDTNMASGGAHYDVTSFIDTLSKADGKNITSEEVTILSSDAARPGEAPPSESVDQKQPTLQLRPILLPLVANERKNVPTVNDRPARKAQSPPPAVRFQESNAALRPLLLGTSATSIPVLLPSSTMVPLGTRKISEAKRVGKRQISAPRVDMAEMGPEAFERPRRPPEYST